jgi:MoaA/NifB/PqqE/SkfB family radical SAM enzyme
MSVEVIPNNELYKSTRSVPDAHFFRTKEGQPTVVYLLNQGICSAHCSHCYVNKKIEGEAGRDIEQAFVDIRRLQESSYRVILRGTEILLNLKFLKLFSLVNQTYLQTNGLIIAENPQILSLIRDAGINHLIFTYPFLENGITDIPKSIVEKAVKISRYDFGITLSIIVTKDFADNTALLSQACAKALVLGVRAIKFIRLMPINPKHISLTLKSEQSIIILSELDRLKKIFDYNELIIQTPGCFGMFSHRRSLNKEKYSEADLSGVYDCPAGIKHFVIDAQNDIYPCLYLMGQEHKIGRYEDNKFELLQCPTGYEFWGKLRTEECPAFNYWNDYGNKS